MRWLLAVIGVLFIGFGVVSVAAIRSDIQVILAVLCFGFGFMIWGQAAVIEQLQRARS